MAFEQFEKYPKLSFLKGPEFQYMEPERQKYLEGLIEDALFWIEQDNEKGGAKNFFFLGSALGLMGAEEKAKEQGLQGEAKENHLKPHKQFYTQFNPYSGKGLEEK